MSCFGIYIQRLQCLTITSSNHHQRLLLSIRWGLRCAVSRLRFMIISSWKARTSHGRRRQGHRTRGWNRRPMNCRRYVSGAWTWSRGSVRPVGTTTCGGTPLISATTLRVMLSISRTTPVSTTSVPSASWTGWPRRRLSRRTPLSVSHGGGRSLRLAKEKRSDLFSFRPRVVFM